MKQISKDITIKKAENGFIIHVIYYEKLESVQDFVKVEKVWIAGSESEKDYVIKNLL